MLTAYSDFANAERAVNMGAFAFITKPFDNDEIIKIINRALNSGTK
jgi:two-component system response regulator HydG